MKEENKKEIRKGVLTGVGTAAGAVIGAVVENTINTTDVEDKELQETEVIDAIEGDLNETQEVDQSTQEIGFVSSDIFVNETAPSIQHPERNHAQQNANSSFHRPTSKEEVETFIQAEAVIEMETESEEANIEESDSDEDIMVVSVVPEESNEDGFEISDFTTGIADIEDISEDNNQVPNYADIKDNDLNVGASTMTAVDMPDYVNDANIDSFTDNV